MKNKRAHNFKDKSGIEINNWLIVSYSHTVYGKKAAYLCRCKCGHEIVKPVSEILREISKSCGCLNAKNHTSHGMAKSRIYRIWKGMKNRCYNSNSDRFVYYGGRGITVCDRWLNSFENFFQDMGEPETINLSIDRINNDGNYEPTNCKWSTKSQQALNRRTPATSTHPLILLED